MALVQDIVSSALRRIGEVPGGQTPRASDSALGLDYYNRMLAGWARLGVNVEHQTASLADPFRLFVPDRELDGATLAALAYQGTWNASTNSPALASGTGTKGYLYRVSTAGSTTLDSVTSWAADDYAVFDGTVWRKSRSPSRHEQSVIDLLAVSLLDDFGQEAPVALASAARDAWHGIQAEYIRVDRATFDPGLTRMPSRRFTGSLI